jgi:hypothetical protein
MCLSFAYHMYGADMGSLRVVYDNTSVFYESGNEGNQWNQAEVTLTTSQSSSSTVFIYKIIYQHDIITVMTNNMGEQRKCLFVEFKGLYYESFNTKKDSKTSFL